MKTEYSVRTFYGGSQTSSRFDESLELMLNDRAADGWTLFRIISRPNDHITVVFTRQRKK